MANNKIVSNSEMSPNHDSDYIVFTVFHTLHPSFSVAHIYIPSRSMLKIIEKGYRVIFMLMGNIDQLSAKYLYDYTY